MKLSDAKLRTLSTPGKHFDGGGLYLELTKAGGRYWRMKYRHAGRENRLSFGVYPAITLKEARDLHTFLPLLVLTATRPGEVCGATWAEFDLDAALWTIPHSA